VSDGWQLVAHPDADVCDMAALSVQRALRQQKLMARVDSVANIAAAQESLKLHGSSKVDLIVIASTMPADDTTSVGFSSRDATKQFIRQLKMKDYPELPVIVVASTPDERLADFLDAYDQTGLVTLGSDFGPSLVQRICALRAGSTSGAGHESDAPARDRRDDSWIHIDIHLDGDRSRWLIERVGANEFESQGTLQLDKRQLSRFINDSKRLDEDVANNNDQWFERLKELSNDLRQLLFRNASDNMDFWDRLLKHRERVGGVSRSRIRVTVDDATHSMLFEALRDSEDIDDEFWVLNAPIFRRYAQPMALPPLFKERDPASRNKPINCLIIEADGEPGIVVDASGIDESFPRLKHLKGEADAVEAILRRHAGGKVERLSLAEVDGDLRACVVAKLGELQWHVVHFCGHVGGDAEHAGLVLRADAAGVLPVKKLADALTRTQLLFLSSCRSASTRIVMHAVRRLVSAVVGFQWVIDDQAASEFAIGFYDQLFSTADAHARDLEYALLKARRKIYKQHPEHPSWVAPVLVMQMR
jgi:DNA-binding NarL/FixJ family response regulator